VDLSALLAIDPDKQDLTSAKSWKGAGLNKVLQGLREILLYTPASTP
jgi:hypothetical protein